MKKEKKLLKLNKTTIASLNEASLSNIKGGSGSDGGPGIHPPGCPGGGGQAYGRY